MRGGGFYRRFDFDTVDFRRDSSYCCAFTCAPGTGGLPVTSDIAELFELGNAGQPSGNINAWIVPDLDAGTALIDLYNRPAVLQQGGQRAVTEKTYGGRSEEHTSELQSLMRISYAVFCLKKKT